MLNPPAPGRSAAKTAKRAKAAAKKPAAAKSKPKTKSASGDVK